MRYRDEQKGKPQILFKGTKSEIEALTKVKGMVAYATDTNEFGSCDGSTWTWGSGGTSTPYLIRSTNGSDVTIPAGYSMVIAGSYEISDGDSLELADNAIMEIG
jgi:hypothetical protein